MFSFAAAAVGWLIVIIQVEYIALAFANSAYRPNDDRSSCAHRSTTNESLIVLDFAGFLCVFSFHL